MFSQPERRGPFALRQANLMKRAAERRKEGTRCGRSDWPKLALRGLPASLTLRQMPFLASIGRSVAFVFVQ